MTSNTKTVLYKDDIPKVEISFLGRISGVEFTKEHVFNTLEVAAECLDQADIWVNSHMIRALSSDYRRAYLKLEWFTEEEFLDEIVIEGDSAQIVAYAGYWHETNKELVAAKLAKALYEEKSYTAEILVPLALEERSITNNDKTVELDVKIMPYDGKSKFKVELVAESNQIEFEINRPTENTKEDYIDLARQIANNFYEYYE